MKKPWTEEELMNAPVSEMDKLWARPELNHAKELYKITTEFECETGRRPKHIYMGHDRGTRFLQYMDFHTFCRYKCAMPDEKCWFEWSGFKVHKVVDDPEHLGCG